MIPTFDFKVPTELPGVDPKILDPRDTYANPAEWETKAEDLANRNFVKNFVKFTIANGVLNRFSGLLKRFSLFGRMPSADC